MRTQYYTASSLDGFIADRENSLAWLLQFGDVAESSYPSFIAKVGAMAMGSTTYAWLLENMDAGFGEGAKWPYRHPTWVFTTRSFPGIEGADIRFVRGDVRPVHREMRKVAGERNLWIVGGGELAGQFHDHGLLDDLIVQVAAVTLGGGAPLFPRAVTTPPLRLVSAERFGASFVELRYEVPGNDPHRGSPDEA